MGKPGPRPPHPLWVPVSMSFPGEPSPAASPRPSCLHVGDHRPQSTPRRGDGSCAWSHAGTHPRQPQRSTSCRGDTPAPPGTSGSPPDGAGEVLVVLAGPQAHLPLLGRDGRHRSAQDALQSCKGSQPSLGLPAAAWGGQMPPGQPTGVGTCPQAPVYTHRRCSTETEPDCQLPAAWARQRSQASHSQWRPSMTREAAGEWGKHPGVCLVLTFAVNLKQL